MRHCRIAMITPLATVTQNQGMHSYIYHLIWVKHIHEWCHDYNACKLFMRFLSVLYINMHFPFIENILTQIVDVEERLLAFKWWRAFERCGVSGYYLQIVDWCACCIFSSVLPTERVRSARLLHRSSSAGLQGLARCIWMLYAKRYKLLFS